MKISFNDPTSIQQDTSWSLQGRIIPPSCTNGEGCIMHLQARNGSWPKEHFHVGRIPISTEAGIEFLMSILIPPFEDLLVDSFDTEEQKNDLDYLHMVRIGNLEDAIAFLTVNGLTIIIQAEGLNEMFGPSKQCTYCMISSKVPVVVAPNEKLDSLMEIVANEKSH